MKSSSHKTCQITYVEAEAVGFSRFRFHSFRFHIPDADDGSIYCKLRAIFQ